MKGVVASRWLAASALAGMAYYVAAVVLLATLHPKMSALETPISGYQKTSYPFLAGTTFFVLAAAVAALNLALRAALPRSWVAALGLTLAWTAVAGIAIAGVFPSRPMLLAVGFPIVAAPQGLQETPRRFSADSPLVLLSGSVRAG